MVGVLQILVDARAGRDDLATGLNLSLRIRIGDCAADFQQVGDSILLSARNDNDGAGEEKEKEKEKENMVTRGARFSLGDRGLRPFGFVNALAAVPATVEVSKGRKKVHVMRSSLRQFLRPEKRRGEYTGVSLNHRLVMAIPVDGVPSLVLHISSFWAQRKVSMGIVRQSDGSKERTRLFTHTPMLKDVKQAREAYILEKYGPKTNTLKPIAAVPIDTHESERAAGSLRILATLTPADCELKAKDVVQIESLVRCHDARTLDAFTKYIQDQDTAALARRLKSLVEMKESFMLLDAPSRGVSAMITEGRLLNESHIRPSRAWAWFTRQSYDTAALRPYGSYCSYLQKEKSPFWTVESLVR